VFLGGVPVPADQVRVLSTLVTDRELAERLLRSVERDAIVIRLDVAERAAIVKALAAQRRELEDLRQALATQPGDERDVRRFAADTAA
jgi:hypothetical protein